MMVSTWVVTAVIETVVIICFEIQFFFILAGGILPPAFPFHVHGRIRNT